MWTCSPALHSSETCQGGTGRRAGAGLWVGDGGAAAIDGRAGGSERRYSMLARPKPALITCANVHIARPRRGNCCSRRLHETKVRKLPENCQKKSGQRAVSGKLCAPLKVAKRRAKHTSENCVQFSGSFRTGFCAVFLQVFVTLFVHVAEEFFRFL